MSPTFSIVVVTYVRRFHRYFIPMLDALRRLYPTHEICVMVNGYPDATRQLLYLREAAPLLTDRRVSYLTFIEHQPLARLWNLGIILSHSEKVLIMNDDILVSPAFIEPFAKIVEQEELTRLNGTFSHFLISRSAVRRYGFFDENLRGMGQEDWDYMIRVALAGGAWDRDVPCPGITHLMADSDDPSWQSISGVVNDKYAALNLDYFNCKWRRSEVMLAGCPDLSSYFPFRGAALNDGFEAGPGYDQALLREGAVLPPSSVRFRQRTREGRAWLRGLLRDVGLFRPRR